MVENINARGGLTKFLFDRGMQAKSAGLARGYNTHWFYDTFVFSKIKQSIGLDRILVTISGSAPLSAEVLTFLRCVLGNKVVEGYGATETSGATLLPDPYDYTCGHVGGPMTCCDMRLEDVPDMSYLHTDKEHNGEPCIGRGELCLRVGVCVWDEEQGANVSPGYFRHPELTKEAFDEDGFFHTGDIVMVYPNGATKVRVDRAFHRRSSTARRTSSSCRRASTWRRRSWRSSTDSAPWSVRSSCTATPRGRSWWPSWWRTSRA